MSARRRTQRSARRTNQNRSRDGCSDRGWRAAECGCRTGGKLSGRAPTLTACADGIDDGEARVRGWNGSVRLGRPAADSEPGAFTQGNRLDRAVTSGDDFDGCVLTWAAPAEAGVRQRQSWRGRTAQTNEENESRKSRE